MRIRQDNRHDKSVTNGLIAFPGGTVVKNPPANAGDTREAGSIPESGRSPAVGKGNPSSILA